MYFQSENQSGSTAFTLKDNSVPSRTRVTTKKGKIYALKLPCPLNMAEYFSSFSSNKYRVGGGGGGGGGQGGYLLRMKRAIKSFAIKYKKVK